MGDGLVDYHIETPDKVKSIFQNAGVSTPSYNKLKLNNQQSIDTFKKAIAKAKQSLGNDGASVELKDDYTDINLYLSEDGESGFGIKPNGDIVSVFSSKKVKGRSAHMLEMAISQGGRQLDCFDVYLVEIYEAHGFKPVAKMKWNGEYIPEGWNKDNFKDYNNGEPVLTAGRRHVVFMVYAPNTKKDNEIPYIIDYDDGDKIQQKYFAKNKVDSLIDAKKKEFKEEDVNRDEDGKFATQNAGRRQEAENIKRKKEEEDKLKKEQKKEEAKNKKKEKDENNKVSGKEGAENKSKKITKNYSISYDNETIEKLNSIGKNWKDKRIYFKELNNGYYDLENKKWVTDSPELTEKGLLLAGETDEEKTARLEAEKQAIEKREAEKQAKKEEAEKKSYDSRLKMQDAISKTEDKDILKTLKDMGVFEANLKFPSTREFAKKLWGFDIDELTKNDKYEVNDRIFNKIKSEMKYMQSLTSPSWQGWLKNYKAKESAEMYEAKQLEYNMGALGKDPFNDYLEGEYNNGWNRGDSEANKVLWNKYKNEYEEYKRSKKAAEDGHERLKEYLSKYDINIDSKVFVDSLIDLNNYIDTDDGDVDITEEEINNDIEYYIDSVKEYIDAKKKEFKESDVNRDADGKFAKKPSSNKSNDLDTNALKDFGLNQRQIIKLTTKLEDLGIIEYNEDNDTYKIKSSITEGIENNEIKEILGDKFDIIKNSFNSDNNDNEDDIDNEKQKSLILKDNDKRTIKECIKSLPKHLQDTGNKLYNNNPIPSDLIIKDDANYDTEDILAYIDDDNVDEEKYSQLNEIETLLNRFTENAQGTRESNTFKRLRKDIEELIENAPPVKNPHRVEYMIEVRDDLSIGTVINFDIRSFADFGAGDKTANKIYNYLRDEVDPSKLVVYVIDDEVNALDMTTISSYPNQNECLINGDFIISEVEEGDEYNPPIVHLKKYKK